MTDFIQALVPGAILSHQTLRELSYTLPFDGIKGGHFPRLFAKLEEKKDALYLSSYGLMDTSLEEVFLKVAEQSGANKEGLLSWKFICTRSMIY